MRTGNASSTVVALLTKLQERAFLHAVCWKTQSPNASSIPSQIDDKHDKTPRWKWFYSEVEDINVYDNLSTENDKTIGTSSFKK